VKADRLYRFRGNGRAACVDCAKDTLDANVGFMTPRDFFQDELGATSCDVCDATIVHLFDKTKEVSK